MWKIKELQRVLSNRYATELAKLLLTPISISGWNMTSGPIVTQRVDFEKKEKKLKMRFSG